MRYSILLIAACSLVSFSEISNALAGGFHPLLAVPAITPNKNLTEDSITKIRTGIIKEKCLWSWDDSHQVDRLETVLKWDNQTIKTRMKKLHHCIDLRVEGPIDIDGIAGKYVDYCIDFALNDGKTQHLVEVILGLGVDYFIGGAGSATTAALADYISNVKEKSIDCLTDQDKITFYLQDALKAKFDASVNHETNWVYWYL